MLTKLTNLAGPPGLPGTIPTEAAIANAMDGQLVRDAFGEAISEELDDTGSPIRISVDERIAAGISSSVVAEVTAQNATLWTPNKRRLGLLTECVIVGSSNALSSTWGTEFCSTWGLTQRNFAVGGSGFTSTNNFLSQLQAAAASSSFSNATVGLVVICDASNNIREWNDTGNTRDVTNDAKAAFSYARATFPNARIVCVPAIWPAAPAAAVTNVPGGYQAAWSLGMAAIVQQIKEAARLHNVEVVDQSWTWLTGLVGVMASDGSVHPNAAGYTLVSQWISRHLRGESTRKDTAWEAVQYSSAAPISGGAPLRLRLEGWTAYLNGTLKTDPFPAGGGFTDVALIRDGLRPPYGWEIHARVNGASTPTGMQLNANGVLRIWANVPGGTEYFISGSYTLN